MFGVDSIDTSRQDVYATVSNVVGDKQEKAKLVCLYDHTPTNQIIISRGLAKELGCDGGEEVRILEINRDVSGLDLDSYLRQD